MRNTGWPVFCGQQEQRKKSMLSHTSPIEPEGILVQVLLEVDSLHSAMVGAAEPSLEIAYDLVDPREELAGPFRGFLDSGYVVYPQGAPVRVPVEGDAIRADLAAGRDVRRDKLSNEVPGERRQVLHTNTPGVVPPILDCNYDNSLRFRPSADTALAFLDAANIGVVQLNDPIERFSLRVHGGPAQAPAHVERASVGPNPQLALELERGYPRSQSAHEIDSPEPVAQRQMTSMQNSSGRNRSQLAAAPAPPEAKAHPPRFIVATTGAKKSGRPADGGKIFQACALRGEPALEFSQSAGKRGISCGRALSSHLSRLSL